MLLNLVFFKALLCCCKTDTDVYYMEGMDNLGTVADGAECVCIVVAYNLGDDSTKIVCDIGIGSTLLSCVAVFNNVFLLDRRLLGLEL